MWEKVVLNLVSNAFKFTHAGEIRVTLRREGAFAKLAVEDTGIGIPEAELSHVFTRFHRVKGAKGRTHEGSGIGLALVQDLAKLHGGSAEVQSEFGKGSRFVVRVPFAGTGDGAIANPVPPVAPTDAVRANAFVEEAIRWLPNQESEHGQDQVPIARAESAAGARFRILLADDNADMRDYVRRLLQSRYDVTAVGNGAEALAAARQLRPDLLLSDVMMPVMDGMDLVKHIRADDALRTLPVILLSARAGEDETASGLETGADDYLIKPFSARELLARVNAQVSMSTLRLRAAEQANRLVTLNDQQRWLEAVLDRLPVPTALVDAVSGEFDFANRAAVALAGGQFPPNLEAAERGTHFRATDENDRLLDAGETPGTRTQRGESVRDAEIVWHSPAGRYNLIVDSDFVPARGEQPSRGIITFRDVSRLKRVERELNGLLDARDEFLAIASHELKTPITSLRMQLQMAERGMVANSSPDSAAIDKLSKRIGVASAQVDRLTALVEALLDVARIRSGSLDLTFEPTDLVLLLRETLERLAPQIAKAGCTTRIQAPSQIMAVVDARRVEQVLTNLMSNALKYAPGLPVDLQVSEEPDVVRFEVRDFGPGVAPALRDTIFDRFDRGAASRNAGGLGLGLFIARQLVAAHGGRIDVESATEGGARFVIRLPRDCSSTNRTLTEAPV